MSTNLTKLFTVVAAKDHDQFVKKYIAPDKDQPRYIDYDNKIVFLSKTQEIFTGGKIYGINTLDDILFVCNNVIGTVPKVDESVKTAIDYVNYCKLEVYNSIEAISEDSINNLFVYAPV